jgi:hypothetical protein
MRFYWTAVTMLVLGVTAGRADDKKEDPKPNELPVKATLVAKTTTYKLDLAGMSAEEYKKTLQEGEKSGKAPAPPVVELTLELKNTSDKDVQVWISGDPVVLNLDLKGTGAVSLKPRVAFTTIFIGPEPVTIAAGKTHEIPITSLKYGFRNAEKMAYWTEPGEHTLTASLKTAISPVPAGVKETKGDFGFVQLMAEPIKIKVEAK